MNLFVHSIKTKGLKNFIMRFLSIYNRFGVSPKKYIKNFEKFIELQNEFNFKTTFPITASVYEKHKEKLKPFKDTFKFMLHGLYHIDYTKIKKETIKQHLQKGSSILKNYLNYNEIGFRAPYLRYNETVKSALIESSIKFESSISILIEDIIKIDSKNKKIINRLYNPKKYKAYPSLPIYYENIIELPVILPDDEILIDRLNIKNEKIILKILINILETIIKNEEMYIMQIHPERINFMFEAIKTLLEKSKKENIWITNLYEIYEWVKKTPTLKEINIQNKTIALENIQSRKITPLNTEINLKNNSITYKSEILPIIYMETNQNNTIKNLLKFDGFIITEDNSIKDKCSICISKNEIERINISQYRNFTYKLQKTNKPLIKMSRWPDGKKAAFSLSGDIDALTIQDFFLRAIHFYKEK